MRVVVNQTFAVLRLCSYALEDTCGEAESLLCLEQGIFFLSAQARGTSTAVGEWLATTAQPFIQRHSWCLTACQDGRAVYGAAFRAQSTLVGVGSNPTSDTFFHHIFLVKLCLNSCTAVYTKTFDLCDSYVRMAERSKALRSGRSLLL